MIKLVKFGTSDEFSFSDAGDDPISFSANLTDDSNPLSVTGVTVTASLTATQYLYTNISISASNEETGINYQLSLDGINWFDVLTSGAGGDAVGQIPNLSATASGQSKTIYSRPIILNNGSVSAGTKVQANIVLFATENQ